MSTRCLRSGGVGFPSSLTWKTSSQHGKSLCLVSGEEDIWGIHVSTSPLTHTHTYIHTRTCKYNTHAHYTHIALESLLIHLGRSYWSWALLKFCFGFSSLKVSVVGLEGRISGSDSIMGSLTKESGNCSFDLPPQVRKRCWRGLEWPMNQSLCSFFHTNAQ